MPLLATTVSQYKVKLKADEEKAQFKVQITQMVPSKRLTHEEQRGSERAAEQVRCGRSSNGNDIETKRTDNSIIWVFSVSKRKEPTYSITWKDRSEANTIIIIVCRNEEITNIISPELAGSKRNRT